MSKVRGAFSDQIRKVLDGAGAESGVDVEPEVFVSDFLNEVEVFRK